MLFIIIHIGSYYDKDGYGYCLIINNEDFSQSGLSIREGTSVDSLGIKKVLKDRNVTVREVSNCTALQIQDNLSDLSSINGAMYQFLIVIILSHGYYGRVSGVDGIRIMYRKCCVLLICLSLKTRQKFSYCTHARKMNLKNTMTVIFL